MTNYKLNLNIKLGEIRYLGVPDIIDNNDSGLRNAKQRIQ